MTDVHALIVFYSRYGRAEKLALAAGVGAIQARASIRLRRVDDRADAATIEADAAWRDNLRRMRSDYVAPRPADPSWADLVILATPADSPRELSAYLETLAGAEGMAGRVAAVLSADDDPGALKEVYAAAADAGFIVVPAPAATEATDADPIARARTYGRRATEIARVLRSRP